MSVRTMYDGVTAADLPTTAEMIAGYSTGRYAWTTADWARFPRAVKVRIDVTGLYPAGSDVLDVESGDATLGDVKAWIHARVPHGRACVYTSRANVEALSVECAGMVGVDCWISDWTGEPHEIALPSNLHLCAVQFENTPGYDLSCVYDSSWPGGEV